MNSSFNCNSEVNITCGDQRGIFIGVTVIWALLTFAVASAIAYYFGQSISLAFVKRFPHFYYKVADRWIEYAFALSNLQILVFVFMQEANINNIDAILGVPFYLSSIETVVALNLFFTYVSYFVLWVLSASLIGGDFFQIIIVIGLPIVLARVYFHPFRVGIWSFYSLILIVATIIKQWIKTSFEVVFVGPAVPITFLFLLEVYMRCNSKKEEEFSLELFILRWRLATFISAIIMIWTDFLKTWTEVTYSGFGMMKVVSQVLYTVAMLRIVIGYSLKIFAYFFQRCIETDRIHALADSILNRSAFDLAFESGIFIPIFVLAGLKIEENNDNNNNNNNDDNNNNNNGEDGSYANKDNNSNTVVLVVVPSPTQDIQESNPIPIASEVNVVENTKEATI